MTSAISSSEGLLLNSGSSDLLWPMKYEQDGPLASVLACVCSLSLLPTLREWQLSARLCSSRMRTQRDSQSSVKAVNSRRDWLLSVTAVWGLFVTAALYTESGLIYSLHDPSKQLHLSIKPNAGLFVLSTSLLSCHLLMNH